MDTSINGGLAAQDDPWFLVTISSPQAVERQRTMSHEELVDEYPMLGYFDLDHGSFVSLTWVTDCPSTLKIEAGRHLEEDRK